MRDWGGRDKFDHDGREEKDWRESGLDCSQVVVMISFGGHMEGRVV